MTKKRTMIEVDIPKELEILNPELAKGIIVIGSKAYEMYPMSEGDLEVISADLKSLWDKVFCPDRKCPKCGLVVKWAMQKKIYNCPADAEDLQDMAESPIEAILSVSKIPEWAETITGIPTAKVRDEMTLPQMKHFAGLFFRQNLSDVTLPEESLANFKGLLAMFRIGEKKPETEGAPAAAKPSP